MPSHPRALVVAVASTAALGLAAPAHADVERTGDARGDTTFLRGAAASGDPAHSGYSTSSSADVVRGSARYTRGRVTVTVRVADLDARNVESTATLVTDERERYDASVFRSGARTRVQVRTTNGSVVPCEGKRGSVDVRSGRMTVSIPGRCLDFPRWVRWGVRTFAFEGTRGRLDDARRRGDADLPTRIGARRLRNN